MKETKQVGTSLSTKIVERIDKIRALLLYKNIEVSRSKIIRVFFEKNFSKLTNDEIINIIVKNKGSEKENV